MDIGILNKPINVELHRAIPYSPSFRRCDLIPPNVEPIVKSVTRRDVIKAGLVSIFQDDVRWFWGQVLGMPYSNGLNEACSGPYIANVTFDPYSVLVGLRVVFATSSADVSQTEISRNEIRPIDSGSHPDRFGGGDSSPNCSAQGGEESEYFKSSGADLPFNPINLVFGSFGHAPLLAQITIIGTLGLVTQLLVFAGIGLLLGIIGGRSRRLWGGCCFFGAINSCGVAFVLIHIFASQ